MRSFLLAVGFTVAASALLACSGEQDARTTGRGGSGGGGGSGGMAGSGMGGSSAGTGGGTVVVMPEPDAGAMTADAGTTPGEFTYPAGCPTPNPVGQPGQKVAIQSYNFDTSEVVLKNISSTPQTIVGQRLGWQWCSFPAYWNIAPQGDVVLPPGKTYKFILIYNTMGLWLVPPEGGELAIYVQSGTFDEPDKLVSFVSWGEGLATAGREYVATMAELWTFDDRVVIHDGDSGFIATGDTKVASGYQSVPARCLVAPENGE
ncbi:MAG TPA: hypothetical protein VFS67_18075 [Polyangiaceae bacterium]|jgi:hypothetical protein|nr:hypothetical protein [Polyangiaceae bacterium]